MSATQNTIQLPVVDEQAPAPVEEGQHEVIEWAEPAVAFTERRPSTLRRHYERGMVTAEYAVGILAAIALALVLVGVFHESSFQKEMLQQVTKLIGQIGASIGR